MPVLLFVGLLLPACSSTKAVEEGRPRVADYENFDPGDYPDELPEEDVTVEHDVPEILMESEAENAPREENPRTLTGFRIQVSSYQERDEANASLQDVLMWWSESAPFGEPDEEEEAPVYIDWEQPYWKIRLGDFENRAQAQAVLPDVKRQYPGAFIVPSRITVEQK